MARCAPRWKEGDTIGSGDRVMFVVSSDDMLHISCKSATHPDHQGLSLDGWVSETDINDFAVTLTCVYCSNKTGYDHWSHNLISSVRLVTPCSAYFPPEKWGKWFDRIIAKIKSLVVEDPLRMKSDLGIFICDHIQSISMYRIDTIKAYRIITLLQSLNPFIKLLH